MDEEIRHLQRLASINDPEAKDKLFNLIRRLGLPPEFGLNRDLRPYRCTFCGHEEKLSTNHTSLIYSIYCKSCSWKGMRDEFGDYHQPSGRTFAYAGYELGEGQRSCNCPSCHSSESKYSRNPITPHRLYAVLYRAIWPTADPGSSGEAEMARNLAVRFLKDVTVVDLPQLQGVLLRVWEGPAKQPGAFQKLRDIYDLAAKTNPALPTFLDVAAGVKPQTPRPSSPSPQPKSRAANPLAPEI